MFFRLSNISTIYQILINNILIEYLDIFIVICLNNIMIYSKNLDKYKKYIKVTLDKLFIKEFRYKSEKYEFYKTKANFLRFLVGVKEIKIDPIKIEIVKEWPESKNLTELQRFLGFGNFNRRFISGYSIIILSLTKFIKKIFYLFNQHLNKTSSTN